MTSRGTILMEPTYLMTRARWSTDTESLGRTTAEPCTRVMPRTTLARGSRLRGDVRPASTW
jgi:hypothetical protein